MLQRVPADDLFGGGVRAGGVEHFLPTLTSDRLSRHHAQRPSRRGVHMGDLVRQAGLFAASVNLQGHTATATGEHGQRRRQSLAPLARTSLRSASTFRPRVVQPRVFHQPTGQIAIRRQTAEHALAAVAAVSDHMKTLAFTVLTHQLQHLHCQFRTRAIRTAVFRGALLVQVQAEQDWQTVGVTATERQFDNHAQHDPTVSPIGDRLAATGEQRIVVHSGAKHLHAPLASQRVPTE